MIKTNVLIFAVVWTITLFIVGFMYGKLSGPECVILLPNQGQLQQILNAIEPNEPIDVDYNVGTKTKIKWDIVVFNKYANIYMTPSGAPK